MFVDTVDDGRGTAAVVEAPRVVGMPAAVVREVAPAEGYELGGSGPPASFERRLPRGRGRVRVPPGSRLPWSVLLLCIVTLGVGVVMPVVAGPLGIGVTMVSLLVVAVIARGWAPNDEPWFVQTDRFRVHG
ncbi:MAG TPA: hypothetical protein VGA36_01320 [Nitriliruptorales bacterium]